jgi:ArsR family transcriptional regulator
MKSDDAVAKLAALAHEGRLGIFRLLVRAGGDGLPAGAISESLGIPSATLSFHLKELRNAGVVRCRRDGRSRIYSPDFAAMRELVGFLTESCCRGVKVATAPAPRAKPRAGARSR